MGVKRQLRGSNFSESKGDTTPHPIFSIECKFRTSSPTGEKFIKDSLEQARGYDPSKIPILFSKQKNKKGATVSLYLVDLLSLEFPQDFVVSMHETSFFKNWLRVESRFIKKEKKEVKKPMYRDEFVKHFRRGGPPDDEE